MERPSGKWPHCIRFLRKIEVLNESMITIIYHQQQIIIISFIYFRINFSITDIRTNLTHINWILNDYLL